MKIRQLPGSNNKRSLVEFLLPGMFKRVYNSQTKTVTFAAVLLAFSALLSRLLGLLRDRLLAGNFGAGEELDIYFAAFRIPDFVYGILIIGGISAVFLPVFAEYFHRDEKEAWKFTSNVLNCFLILLVLICGVLFLLTPWLVDLIAPGFSSGQRSLAVSLTRIMFLSPILFGLSSVFSGVLHYFNRFLAYSLAPVLYNLGIIFGIVFLVPIFGLQGLAYGVVLGALMYWLFQLPAAKMSGFKYFAFLDWRHSGILRVFKLMLPRTVGMAAYQLNLIVITAIASTLAAGSIAIFNLSNNLQYFPIGLIGVSFAVAAFPALSREWAQGLKDKFLETFSSAFRQILFLITPVSLLVFLLRAQIVRLVLGTGEFGWLETRLTAASLGLFCLGIFAGALVPFLARVFYSFQDTKTPVVISVVSMLLNIIFALSFVHLLSYSNSFQQFMINSLKLQGIENIGVVGLPLALSLAIIFQFFLLLVFLKRKIAEIRIREICISFWKAILGTVLLGVSVYFSLRFFSGIFDLQTFLGVFWQTSFSALIGVAVFILAAYFLKSPELASIKSAILKQFRK